MTETYCSDSGMPRNEVFARLLAAGLRAEDFSHLEDLSHSEIIQRMAVQGRIKSSIIKSRKADVIAYLRTWAEGIEEFQDKVKMSKPNREAESAPVEI